MKYLFSIVLLFIVNFLNAQGKVVVMYADPSANIDNTHLSSKLYDALQESDSKIILYISNGNSPIVCNSIYEMQTVIDKLSKIKPTTPSYSFDLDSMNRLFNLDSNFSNINERDNNIIDDTWFFFFYNAEKARLLNQVDKFSEALLLSNRYITKTGLAKNCVVRIYISDVITEADKQFVEKLRKEKDYDIIVY